MKQLYHAFRVVTDAMFSTEKGHFRQFCLIRYSFYKMVTFATF